MTKVMRENDRSYFTIFDILVIFDLISKGEWCENEIF